MKITAEPRSDQWNADDFVGGPRVFTIAGVHPGKAEQKYDIELIEGQGRVWRPPLTMLRLLIAAWGDDATEWVGRRVQLFRDASVSFGRDQVGGIRVSALSHIDGPLAVSLTVSRGKRGKFTVQPLEDAPLADLEALFDRKGSPVGKRVEFAAWAVKHPITDLADLTPAEYARVVDELNKREDVQS